MPRKSLKGVIGSLFKSGHRSTPSAPEALPQITLTPTIKTPRPPQASMSARQESLPAYGIYVVAEPRLDDPPAVVDIVAIHGLDGHREQSWTTESGIMWLKDLLPGHLPTARIITYGYDAATQGPRDLSTQTIFGHAQDFLVKFTGIREEDGTGKRPIIFLAHSLGGIVLKYALILSSQANPSHLASHAAVKLSTAGIIFLGTPHQGVPEVDWALTLLRIRSVFSKTNPSLLEPLRRDSDQLLMQIAQFTSISSSFIIKFIYETQATLVPGGQAYVLVPQSCAVVHGALDAESVGMNRNHQNLVKFDSGTDDDFLTLVRFLKQIAHLSSEKVEKAWKDQEQLHFKEPKKEECLIIPPAPTPSALFTGQVHILSQMAEHFPGAVVPGQRNSRRSLLLYGIAGGGKTQVAAKFTAEYSHRFWRVFWVDMSTLEAATASFSIIASGDPDAIAKMVDKSTDAVLLWMASITQKPWLLILDNADDSKNISQYIPRGTAGNIIITSRNQTAIHVVPKDYHIHVESLDFHDAVKLLLQAADLPSDSAHNGCAQAIVTELHCLPLAIHQAGAAIHQGMWRLEEYLDIYHDHRSSLLDDELFSGASGYGRAVYASFELIYKALKAQTELPDSKGAQAAQHAIILLEFFAGLHYNNISREIFRLAAESIHKSQDVDPLDPQFNDLLLFTSMTPEGYWDPFVFGESIRLLITYSIVKLGAAPCTYAIHPLVHAWIQDHYQHNAERAKVYHLRLRVMRNLLIRAIQGASHYDGSYRMLLPHVRSNELSCGNVEYNDNEYWSLCQLYYEMGHHAAAVILIVEIVKYQQEVFGPDGKNTLLWLANLAVSLQDLGYLNWAVQLKQIVLEKQKKSLGEDHPATLQSMANLAAILAKLGHLNEAVELQQTVLEKWKEVLGEDHPFTLYSMANLASTLHDLGHLNTARELKQTVWKKWKEVLGEDHPATLQSMGYLAITLCALGHFDKAAELTQTGLEKQKQVLGEDHPNTLQSMGNLAGILHKLGRLDEAMELGQIVLEKWCGMRGENHPDTLNSMANLAATLHTLGYSNEAMKLKQTVLEKRKEMLGEDHPDTLQSMGHLAVTLHSLSYSNEAAELEQTVLEKQKKMLGEDHPDTLQSMANLAVTLCELGHLNKAVELEQTVLEKRKRVLGKDHPDTLRSIKNLAVTLHKLGNSNKAVELEQTVVLVK